jgi:hypothetical protein
VSELECEFRSISFHHLYFLPNLALDRKCKIKARIILGKEIKMPWKKISKKTTLNCLREEVDNETSVAHF